jgi:hypothetical protein
MTNGSDVTGLVQRFDKPFATIGAARAAALVAFTSRTATARVKIIVESGLYTEGIVIDNFIDYDLGNSVIAPTASSTSCISDNSDALGYTLTTQGQYTAMIYGNATFNALTGVSGYYGIGIISSFSTNLNLYVQCNRINSEYFDTIFMVTGKATVYANYIYNGKTDINTYSPIRFFSAASNPPTLSVFNALIFNNYLGGLAINACIMFQNSSGTAVNRCMLTNCQVGSYSSSVSAISCGVNGALGIGQITLNNTIIFTSSASVPSLTDGGTATSPTPNVNNILRSYLYGVFASYTSSYVNTGVSQSANVVGTISTNTSLIFNQGNPI